MWIMWKVRVDYYRVAYKTVIELIWHIVVFDNIVHKFDFDLKPAKNGWTKYFECFVV